MTTDIGASFEDLAELESKFSILLTVLLEHDRKLAQAMLTHLETMSTMALGTNDKVWMMLENFKAEVEEVIEG